MIQGVSEFESFAAGANDFRFSQRADLIASTIVDEAAVGLLASSTICAQPQTAIAFASMAAR